jgi:hypothetical protein
MNSSENSPSLPAGHPFLNVSDYRSHWTSTTHLSRDTWAWELYVRQGLVRAYDKGVRVGHAAWPVNYTPADTSIAGRVPDDALFGGLPLTVSKATDRQITMSWSPSCMSSDTDYAVYEGALENYGNHGFKFCSTGGLTTITFTPPATTYYLIVPHNEIFEGSYGLGEGDTERSQGPFSCFPQSVGGCP